MEKINIWESNLNDKFLYFTTFEEYINYCKENNKPIDFVLRESFNPNIDNQFDYLDTIAIKQNVLLTYTSKQYPISIAKIGFMNNYINPTYYNENRDSIFKLSYDYFLAYLQNDENTFINIPSYLFSNELLNLIINDKKLIQKDYKINLSSLDDLTEEQKQIIINNHLEFSINVNKIKHKISTRKVIEYYTIEDLQKIDKCNIGIPLEDINYDNFKFINENAIISFVNPTTYDEENFAKCIMELFQVLKTHNNQYNIILPIKNRHLFEKIIKDIPENINLSIENDLFKYDIETYKNEEETLDSLINPIKNNINLSPFEKYLAVYDIVKKFKVYKENNENPEESRYMRFILKNEYIVCVGFAKLLETLLNKVGIQSYNLNVSVDTSYDKGFTKDETLVDLAGHARNLIMIDDDKYDIHGIYIADATWDNSKNNQDEYFNALMTFDRKKEAFRLEALTDEDLLLDFHNEKEFNEKISYMINKIYKKKSIYNNKHRDCVCSVYRQIYLDILKILNDLDNNEYNILFSKYDSRIEQYINNENVISAFEEMLEEYKNYILNKVNKNVPLETILTAAIKEKQELEQLSEEETKEKLEQLVTIHQSKEAKHFPYIYNPDKDIEAYLEDRQNSI